MLSLWMTLLVAAAGLSDGEKPDSPAKSNITATASARSSPRQGYELRDVVRTALRQWARPSDEQSPHAAREFLVLYRELQADSQLAQSQRDTLRTQVRNRLAQLSDQISQRIARDKRQAKAARPKNVAPPPDKLAPLAQQLGPRPAGAGNQGGGGGPGGLRQANVSDAGQDLVDLIQSVISPKSWDVHGGPGSIYYWQPGHALIIRQTSEVHDQISDTLEQLRRAGQ